MKKQFASARAVVAATKQATFSADDDEAKALAVKQAHAALVAHYARAEDEAHSLCSAKAFAASADLEIIGDELHVRLEALSSPRHSRAIARLCAELNATETVYPGTDLRLI